MNDDKDTPDPRPRSLGPKINPSYFGRDHAIALAYARGGTYDSIGEAHELSRERVRQIVRRELRRVATALGIDTDVSAVSVRENVDMWTGALQKAGAREGSPVESDEQP